MKKNIIITGGAGYIGKAVYTLLKNKYYNPLILDRSARKKILINKNIYPENTKNIDKIFKKSKVDCVVHLAAKNISYESKNNPIDFYESNVADNIIMLKKMAQNNVKKIIYISSSGVYGVPQNHLIDEKTKCSPHNAYGRSKFIFENILDDFSKKYNFKYVILRLFNVSGADSKKGFGPSINSTAIIIRIFDHIYTGKKIIISKTSKTNSIDGSPIRDYVHPTDVAQAILKSIKYLDKNKENIVLNIGSGNKASSVIEIIKKIEKKLKTKIKYSFRKDQKKFVETMYPDISKAKTILKYKPQYSSINNIINSNYKWFQKTK